MKNNTRKTILQKMIFALLLIILVFNFIIPQYVFAKNDNGVGGTLLKEVVQLFAALGDAIMGGLNKFMLGSDEFFSAMLNQDSYNLDKNSGSWLVEGVYDQKVDENIESDYMDEKTFLLDASIYKVPNMLYSPENIFANKIAILDVNFLNPNKYSPIIEGNENAIKMAKSAAGGDLQKSIASWYISFRNIAIVALLSVLVYLGIRILISSAAADKAKYKESLKDWFVALCLVFVIHFIMSGIIMATEKFNLIFSKQVDNGIIVEAKHSDESKLESGKSFRFRTNLIGLARFKAQADQWQDAVAYTIIYLALVIYTCIFTFMYFKRFLYMAFFTMIAPLVALTYPMDKVGDGRAQAFNMWFKEYTMNAIIQPVHLILYTVFVTNAIDLATANPIYAIVAIGFLVPAEKFIKKMFGLDKAETPDGFGSFAGGALAMQGIQKLASIGSKKGGSSGGKQKLQDSGESSKIRFSKNGSNGNLNTFNSEDDKKRLPDNNINMENSQYSQQEDNKKEGQNINDIENETSKLDRLYDDRDEWQRIADDENSSELDKEEARQNLDFVNKDIKDEEKSQNKEKWRNRINKTGKFGKFVLKNSAKTAAKGARFTGRALARTSGIVGGAAVGLAAGITTGDMSKALSFAATGAAAGNVIGKNVNKIPGRIYDGARNGISNVRNTMDATKDSFNEEMYGYSMARDKKIERQNSRNMKAFYNDKEEKAKAKDLAGKIGFDGDIKEIMTAKSHYYIAGITDEKLINNSIESEYKQRKTLTGDTHKQYVDAASFIDKSGYSANDIEDEEKMRRIEEKVQAKVVDPRNQRKVMKTLSSVLGQEDLYNQRVRENKTRIKPKDKH